MVILSHMAGHLWLITMHAHLRAIKWNYMGYLKWLHRGIQKYWGTTICLTCYCKFQDEENTISMTSYWTRWRLKSPASPLFNQPFIRRRSTKRSKHKWPVRRKMFLFDDVIMIIVSCYIVKMNIKSISIDLGYIHFNTNPIMYCKCRLNSEEFFTKLFGCVNGTVSFNVYMGIKIDKGSLTSGGWFYINVIQTHRSCIIFTQNINIIETYFQQFVKHILCHKWIYWYVTVSNFQSEDAVEMKFIRICSW